MTSPSRCGSVPSIARHGGARRLHQFRARWPDHDGDHAVAVYWATTDGRVVVKGLVSNGGVRGRDMLRWIASTYRRPIHVVEVLPSSTGFWERMRTEGAVASWDPSDGHASALERLAEPLPRALA